MKNLIVLTALLATQLSHAALVTIGAVVPTGWRVENYAPGGNAVLWFTGSVCANGQLTLPPNATIQDHSRLYATIVSAKAGNLKTFVVYDNGLAGCPISSFGIQ